VSLPDLAIGYGLFYHDIASEIGIMGTPVIVGDAMYLVTFTGDLWSHRHYLHKLDIRTGSDLIAPVEIRTDDPKTGAPLFVNGEGLQVRQKFVSHLQNQRPGLAVSRDSQVLYVAFASYNDTNEFLGIFGANYHGWIFGYSTSDLKPKYAFNTTPDGKEGGIWMAGTAPAVGEDGNIYLTTGNGDFDNTKPNFGDAVLELSPRLQLVSFFTPSENENLQWSDCDLGSSGILLFPRSNLAFAAGKEAVAYVMNRGDLGGFTPPKDHKAQKDHVFQSFPIADPANCKKVSDDQTHHLHGTPVYWDISEHEAYVYLWPENEELRGYLLDPHKGFDFEGGKNPRPFSSSIISEPDGVSGGSTGMPGGMLTLSADGQSKRSGILWALHPWMGNANTHVIKGVLRAFDATDLTHELWNSQKSASDEIGYLAKFAPPTVADGFVFVPTFSKKIQVYGLFP
jgi:hypothetical protein